MWKACKTMGPPPKTMPQKVMPPSLTAPIALFVVAPCFVFGVVIRCAMKLLPCKILGDARKSRQHAVFERCPERCPNDARPDASRPAKSTWPKPVRRTSQAPPASARGHAQLSGVALVPHYPPCFHAPRAAPGKHLTQPVHIVMPGLPRLPPDNVLTCRATSTNAVAYRLVHWSPPCEKKRWWSRARIWTRDLTVISRTL